MRPTKEILKDLDAHLSGEGTMNDMTTDALYREYHNWPEDEDTDLEEVEQWASGSFPLIGEKGGK